MELIRLENLTKTYHLGTIDVPVLRGVSLSIARGEMVALMGVSGSGKTDAHEYSRLPRPAEFRPLLVRRPGNERFDAQSAGPGADGETGLRLPELQLAAADLGHAKRDHALVLCPAPQWRRGIAAARRESFGVGWACRTVRSRAIADVRRPAAASGHRPSPGQPSGPVAGRRADRQPRFAYERGNSADVSEAQCRGHHGDPGNARRQGGRLCASNDPHCRRADRGRRDCRVQRPSCLDTGFLGAGGRWQWQRSSQPRPQRRCFVRRGRHRRGRPWRSGTADGEHGPGRTDRRRAEQSQSKIAARRLSRRSFLPRSALHSAPYGGTRCGRYSQDSASLSA